MNETLRDHLARLEQDGLLLRLDRPVPLTHVPDRMREAERQEKTLIIERPEGFDDPILYNVLASQEHLALAYASSREDVVRRFTHGVENPIAPRLASRPAPVQEIVLEGEAADLTRLPLVVHSKKDAGRYISAGMVVVKDPETGIRNVSFNRMQLKGPRKLGLRMMPTQHLGQIQKKYEDMNQPMEVAVVVGCHPLESVAGSTSPRLGVDEFSLAGGFRGEALDLAPCKTVKLEVPAHAEIVIEGVVLPRERETEGPFGDFMGYYVPIMDNHVLHVKAVTRRKDALWQTMRAGSPEDSRLLGLSREAQILKAVEASGTIVKALTLSPMIFNLFISIEKRSEGEAKNVLMAAFGVYRWLKYAVVVDHDVDVFSKEDVWWAMGTRSCPGRGALLVDNAAGFPRDPYKSHQSKLGIDATAPLNAWEEFERITIPEPGDGTTYPV